MSEKPRSSLIKPGEKIAREVVVREYKESKQEMIDTREKLGEFTVRDFAEGLFGEDFAHIVYGAEGGSMKLNEMKFTMAGNGVEGQASMKLDEEQMIGLMMESHPNLTRDEAKLMLTQQTIPNQQAALQYLNEQEDRIDDAVEDAHKRFQEFRMQELRDDIKNRGGR